MSAQSNIVPLRSGGGIAAIVPQSIDEAFRLASGIARSGLAPKGMDKPEQVMVAVMTGMELGLPPMFAVQKIAVINGRPSIWGDAIPALLWGKGFSIREWMTGDGDKRVAHCEITRPTGDKIERAFSVDAAKEANLWLKAGPWKQYPERMLQMRARGYAARDGAADVLGGLYLREELERAQVEPRDITPRAELEIPDLTAPAQEHSPLEVAETTLEVPDLDLDQDPPLTDEAGFLAKLEEDRRYCESEAELEELREANAEMIARCSPSGQKRAAEILEAE